MPFFAIMENAFQANLIINFAAIQGQANAANPTNYFATKADKEHLGKRSSRPTRRVHTPKVISGRPKTL
jgi:hypothetical protein